MGDFDFKTTSFEFKGFKDLYRAIDHLHEVVLKKELEPLLVQALTPMRDTARHLAPDDPLTGPPWNLPTSIEVSVRQRTGRSKHDRQLGRFDARAYMGPTKYGYPQAVLKEFGHMDRAGIFVPPIPYMRPAWDHEKAGALEIIRSGLAKRLELIAKKYGPRG